MTAIAVTVIAVFLIRVTVLELENTDLQHRFRFLLARGETFSVTYHHSMYEQAITEEFIIDHDARIVLTSLSSASAAVREYFGIYAPGERHAMNRVMPEIVFRVAAGVPQRLRLGNRDLSFLEFGERGDRLVMRARRESLAAYFLTDCTIPATNLRPQQPARKTDER